MQPLPLTLVVLSTFMHAGWNLMARRDRDECGFFRRMLLSTVLAGAIPAVGLQLWLHLLDPGVLPFVLGSGICCGLYYLFLMLGYESADFTVVYPVARALPVLLLGIVDAARHRVPSAAGWLGIVLVAGGCLLAPQVSFRRMRWEAYRTKASLWIVLTALGTVGYTLLDKLAAETLRRGPASAALYGYLFFLVSWAVFEAALALTRKARPGRQRGTWPRAAAGACMNYGAYALVLWAYQLCERASYLAAFRQFSIVVGMALAFVIYRERGLLTRSTAAILITAGLIAIALRG